MQRLHRRVAAILLLTASIVAVAAYAASAAAPQRATTSASKRSNVNAGTFTATVLQGPKAGISYKGPLTLSVSRKGYLAGTLAAAGFPHGIPVTGQLHGQLIGLTLEIGPNQTISGVGVIGYNATTKRNTIAGTFSGPSDTSFGTWAIQYIDPVGAPGGCAFGLNGSLIGHPGTCFIIV